MLTSDNALWCVRVLTVLGAVFVILMWLGRNASTDWDAPARDLDQVDPAETAHWDTQRPTPVAWSRDADGYVCAAPAAHLPGGRCGWPAHLNPCPSHGELVTPHTEGSTR